MANSKKIHFVTNQRAINTKTNHRKCGYEFGKGFSLIHGGQKENRGQIFMEIVLDNVRSSRNKNIKQFMPPTAILKHYTYILKWGTVNLHEIKM
jgi:hypothetical protein